MSDRCCSCPGAGGAGGGKAVNGLPLICLVPRDPAAAPPGSNGGAARPRQSSAPSIDDDFKFLDPDYIAKHFKLPERPLYLDPFRRPLITFPISGDNTKNFNQAKKSKINQMILDGFLDPSEALVAPSVFPYAKNEAEKRKEAEEEEEVIYILQLPDWEYQCPVHNTTVRTPRFIWHSCKKKEKEKSNEMKQGRGPMFRPKPWILSRITDFDMMAQW
ncbi:hypothetical protein NE865_01239 [Phthorimaea operculella]|nr:hypothetical protein NE865_01239 [Phthorimaea operculella]